MFIPLLVLKYPVNPAFDWWGMQNVNPVTSLCVEETEQILRVCLWVREDPLQPCFQGTCTSGVAPAQPFTPAQHDEPAVRCSMYWDCLCFSCCRDRWNKGLLLWSLYPQPAADEKSALWLGGEKYIFYRAWRGDVKSQGWGGGNENELCGTAVLSWQEGMTEHLHRPRLSAATYLWIMESVQWTALCVWLTFMCSPNFVCMKYT